MLFRSKDKIMGNAGISVTIPDFGETYTLDDNLSVEKTVELPRKYKLDIAFTVFERLTS